MDRKRKENAQQSKAWLLTFNDMLTLILAFFVLMLSLSQIGAEKIREVSSSVRGALGVSAQTGQNLVLPPVVSFRDRDISQERDRQYTHEERELRRAAGEIPGSRVFENAGKLVIRLEEGSLFATGRGDMTPGGAARLSPLCRALQETRGTIRVEGYAGKEMEKVRAWKLSAARAMSMVRSLIREGGISPERLSAAGYGGIKTPEPDAHGSIDVVVALPER